MANIIHGLYAGNDKFYPVIKNKNGSITFNGKDYPLVKINGNIATINGTTYGNELENYLGENLIYGMDSSCYPISSEHYSRPADTISTSEKLKDMLTGKARNI